MHDYDMRTQAWLCVRLICASKVCGSSAAATHSHDGIINEGYAVAMVSQRLQPFEAEMKQRESGEVDALQWTDDAVCKMEAVQADKIYLGPSSVGYCSWRLNFTGTKCAHVCTSELMRAQASACACVRAAMYVRLCFFEA